MVRRRSIHKSDKGQPYTGTETDLPDSTPTRNKVQTKSHQHLAKIL